MKKAKLTKVKTKEGRITHLNAFSLNRLKGSYTIIQEGTPPEVEEALSAKAETKKEAEATAAEEAKAKAKAKAEATAKAKAAEAEKKAKKTKESSEEEKEAYKKAVASAKKAEEAGEITKALTYYETAAKIDNNRFIVGKINKLKK